MATAPTTLPNVGMATGRTWWPLATCTRGSGRRARGTARGGTCPPTAASTTTARRPLDWGPPGETLPELAPYVSTPEDEAPKGLNYSALFTHAVAALQQLDQVVQSQASRIAALEAKRPLF